jgi:hypothetical protein
MDETTKFRKLLDGYRDAYLQFVTSGSQQFKDASKTILDEITAMIDARRQQYEGETKLLGSFLSEYKTTQQGLDDLEHKSAQSLKDIQSVKDEYETAQERYQQLEGQGEVPASIVNAQRGYDIVLRLGILLVVLVALFFAGYFFPSETFGFFAQQQQAVASAAAAASAAVAAVSPRPGAFGMGSPMMSPYSRPY